MPESYPSACLEEAVQMSPVNEQVVGVSRRARVAGAVLSALAVVGVTSCGGEGERYKYDPGLTLGYVAEKDHDPAKMGTIKIDSPVGCTKDNGNVSTKTAAPSSRPNPVRTPRRARSINAPVLLPEVKCQTVSVPIEKKPEEYELTLQACFGDPSKQDCRENEITVSKAVYDSAVTDQYFDLNQMPPYTAAPDVFKP